MNSILLESSHKLMARFFDASIRELALVPIYGNDFYNNPEILHDYKSSPFYMTSNDNVITLKSTFYMLPSILSGREIYFLQLGLFNFNINHSLCSMISFVNHFLDTYASPIQTMIPSKSSPSLVEQVPSMSDIEFHIAVDGFDCKVFNIQSKEKDFDETFCLFHALFNTLAINIQKKKSLTITGSLLTSFIELGSEYDDSFVLLSQLTDEGEYGTMNNKLIEFELNDTSIGVKVNQIHIMINPFPLIRSVHSILSIIDKLPIKTLKSSSAPKKKSSELSYSLDLIQPLVEFVVNEEELLCFDCYELKIDYNTLFYFDVSVLAKQLGLYSMYLEPAMKVDYCSDLTGTFSISFNETPLYGVIHVELERLMAQCYPRFISLVNSLQLVFSEMISFCLFKLMTRCANGFKESFCLLAYLLFSQGRDGYFDPFL